MMLMAVLAVAPRQTAPSKPLAIPGAVDPSQLNSLLQGREASLRSLYDPGTGKFLLPPEPAKVFAIEESPVYLMGGFDLMAAMLGRRWEARASQRSVRGIRRS